MDFEEIKALVIEKIKYFYFFFEDRWYRLLDKIDKQVPVYKMVDPIDQVIPSYILTLLLLLFILILIGYLMSFNNTYEIRIVALDADTDKTISEVNIFGSVNQRDFDDYTDNSGELVFDETGPPMNFFEVFVRLIFPHEDEFEFIVSAEKSGYVALTDEEFVLTTNSLEGELYLSPISGGPGDGDGQYPDSITVSLRDDETLEPIKDSSAYIKFRCDNDSSVSTKTVKDSDDGDLDGRFALNQENCLFLITEIGADGYETVRNSFTLTSDRQIDLRPIEDSTTGIARILAVEKDSTPELALSKISVKLNRDNNGTLELIDSELTNNSGTAIISDLDPGTYIITAQSMDVNKPYKPITSSANVSLTIVAGDTTEKTIYLEFLDPNDIRQISIKVVDGNSVTPVIGADLTVYRKRINDNNLVVADEPVLDGATSDINGMIPSVNEDIPVFSVDDEGEIIGIIHKDGYLYEVFEVELFRTGEGPQLVNLVRANTNAGGNAGSAQINVFRGPIDDLDNRIPLRNATTTLHMKVPSLGLERVPIASNITDIMGASMFVGVKPGTYSASAIYGAAFTPISPTKAIDVNQLVPFDLNIDADISYLVVSLYDKDTGVRIVNADEKGRVSIYTLSGSADPTPDLVEVISQDETTYTSANYFTTEKLMIKATATGYAAGLIDVVDLLPTGLAAGPNPIDIYLYPTAGLTGNVNVFFDNVYTDAAMKNEATTWARTDTSTDAYYAKFDVVIHKTDLNYTELLAMVRMDESFVNIESVVLSSPKIFHDTANVFHNTTESLDAPTTANNPSQHTDAYYFPTKVSGEGKQAGTIWAGDEQDGSLWDGTYYLLVKFDLESFTVDDSITMQYRAKEKHVGDNNADSETALKEEIFYMGQSLNCGDFCFRVSLNVDEQSVPINVAFRKRSDTRYSSADDHKLDNQATTGNPFSIEIYNNLETSSAGSLRVYSANTSNSSNTGGNLHFTSATGAQELTVNSNLSISAHNYSSKQNGAIYIAEDDSDDYFVVEFTPTGGVAHRAYVSTYVLGKQLELRDPEFIAGLNDQNFADYFDSKYTNDIPELTSVTINVFRDCDGDKNNIASFEYPGFGVDSPAIIDTWEGRNFFVKEIPGVYRAHVDCLEVDAEADGYEPFHELIWASTGGATDPSLACIDVVGNENDQDVYLDWGDTTEVVVTNNCGASMYAYIEVGLECKIKNSTNTCDYKQQIAPNQTLTYIITGKNITYNPSVQFSDILGFFPVLVKSKKSDTSAYKEYAVADRIAIHLSNPDECFIIDKDTFNFIESNTHDIVINNECQYVEFENYYVPRATLESFVTELNNPSESNISSVNFEWELLAESAEYIINYTDVEHEGFLVGTYQEDLSKDCSNKYVYVAHSGTKEDHAQTCASVGADWVIANIGSEAEFLDMVEYLTDSGAPNDDPYPEEMSDEFYYSYMVGNSCSALEAESWVSQYAASDFAGCSADAVAISWQDNEWEIEDTLNDQYVLCENPTVSCDGGNGTPVLGNPTLSEYTISFDISEYDATTSKILFKWIEKINKDAKTTDSYGAKINEIRVNYADGTTDTITESELNINFDLNPQVKCVCEMTDGNQQTGSSCTSNIDSEHCIIGWDTSPVYDDYGDTNYIHGISYHPITEGDVDTIEMDVTANTAAENLEAYIKPYIKYTTQESDLTISSDATTISTFGLGGFTLYPFEGMTFILRNVSYGNTAVGTTLPEKYCVEKAQGRAGAYDSGGDSAAEYIYWVEPGYSTRTDAQSICSEASGFENLLGEEGTLPNYNGAIPSSVISGLTTYLSGASPIPVGVWGSGESVLLTNGTVGTASSDIIDDYYGSCVYDLRQSQQIVKDSYCPIDNMSNNGIINVICDGSGMEKNCHVEDTSESNIFFNLGYLGSRNPKVRVQVTDNTVVPNTGGTLDEGSVLIWIEGNYLKGRYIGEDIDAFNDGTIELQLNGENVAGTQYGIINIQDYVSRWREKNDDTSTGAGS